MVMLINTSGTTYKVLEALTLDLTGSLALTLLLILFFLLLIGFIFRLPIELTALVLTPIVFVMGLSDSSLIGVLIVWLLFLGVLFAKNILFEKN